MADAEDDISDRTLSLIGHLKGLVKLRLDRCDATDKGVAFARELPDLQMISGFQTSFEGKCFKALAGHKKLRSISLPTSGMKDENVQYLAALPRLQFLTLSRCHLSDAGIQNLSGCVELRYLDLSDNPYITDRSIKPLLALKNLRVLILSNTSMTNLGAKQFKQLKLERLKLPQRVNQPAELKAIQEAMPGIRVNAGDGGGKKVDSETNKLFAPLH
jgi:Leucine-rich repeat (LRR) protein